MQPNRVPTIEQAKSFLEEYGWRFRETTSGTKVCLIAPYTLEKEKKGILISFKVEGEFVIV